jgi:hypothetical protein
MRKRKRALPRQRDVATTELIQALWRWLRSFAAATIANGAIAVQYLKFNRLEFFSIVLKIGPLGTFTRRICPRRHLMRVDALL